MGLVTVRSITAIFFSCFLINSVSAEIYKYQDANGKWHFSDKAPSADKKVEVVSYQGASSSDSEEVHQDLKLLLEEKFKPQTAVERNTLAVVSIESPAATGSGFFVSPLGHIVTNKHVVRPAETKQWQQSASAIAKQRDKLEKVKRELQKRKKRLDGMSEDLNAYKRELDEYYGAKRKIVENDYKEYALRYREHKAEYRSYRDFYQQRKREFERANSEFAVISSSSRVANRFRVILKDETELQASLVTLSNAHDLALLKLDGYKTPYISAASSAVAQGSQVYAIGSPLGLKDFVTSGIITSIKENLLVTDTKILPGNSGGPLINAAGELLGVNTQVLSAGALGSELFGYAIPNRILQKEFAKHLVGTSNN